MSMDAYQLIDTLCTYTNTSAAFRGTAAQRWEWSWAELVWGIFFFFVDDAWNGLKVFLLNKIIEEKVNAVLLFLFPASVRILELEASLLEAISCFVYKEYFECGSSLFLSGFFN